MNPNGPALPGHFYAVGVGPGAPDLLTLRAARLVETADVIIAPRSEAAGESLALTAVRALIARQEIIENTYPMERDRHKTAQCWGQAARQAAERCGCGQSVVQITIGDPLIYSTSAYLLGALAELLPEDKIHVVPGISAFQAGAARFAEPLTLQEDRLTMMPATDMDEVGQALGHCETLVLYKVGPRLRALAALLETRGLLDRARLICRAEQGARELMLKGLASESPEACGYMSTVIVHVGRRQWE